MAPETYDHEIEVQYRDLDPRKHVNHAVFVSYLEQAKGAFFVDVLDTSLADANTAIRTLEVDYEAPIMPDRRVRVSLGPVTVGETSYTIDYEIASQGEVVAAATTVSILLDEDGRPRSLPDAWRRRLDPYTPEEA